MTIGSAPSTTIGARKTSGELRGCIVSDIERAAFEQAVADKWSDSYKFTRFGDEDYYDEVLEGMWWGWQAGRRALVGESMEDDQ